MANFIGGQPTEFNRFAGFVDQDDPTNLPLGVAALARNCKFALTSVKTRYGVQLAIQGLNQKPISGLLGAIYTPVTAEDSFVQMPLIFDLDGLLQLETPVGTGRAVSVLSNLLTLPSDSHMIGTQAFNCGFLAFSDLLRPTGPMATLSLGLARQLKIPEGQSSILTGFQITRFAATVNTIAPGTYWVAVTKFTTEGEVAISPQFGPIAAGSTLWIKVVFPASVDAVKWRVYYSAPDAPLGSPLIQYKEYTEGEIAGFGRVVLIGSDGTAGSPEVTPPFTALEPYGWKPVGAGWITAKRYLVGDYVTPSYIQNGSTYAKTTGHTYRCTQAGVTGDTQPIWPLGVGDTVMDGDVIWEEDTAGFEELNVATIEFANDDLLRVDEITNGGTFAAGRDVYFLQTYLTLGGESKPNPSPTKFTSTQTNDGIRVTIESPNFRYLLPHIDSVNLYECDVPTGDPVPLPAAFALVGNYQFDDAPVIEAAAVGVAPPGASTATGQGNIATGLRYMAVAFVNRLGSISGIVRAAIANFSLNVTDTDRALRCFNLPIGPENTVQRIMAFTAAAGTPAGPFFYIPQSLVSDGVFMTSTVIQNNTDTVAEFNFTDEFLIGSQGTNITDRLEVIEPNECIDAYYSATTGRIFQTGVPGFYSGCWVSIGQDGESYYGADRSVIAIGADDGQRTWCIREYKETIYALRERSGFVITPTQPSESDPNAGDPANWAAVQRWGPAEAGGGSSVGPCGARAVGVCNSFMFFVHRSGGYLYTDTEPECVTKEIPKFWNTINWKAAHTICVGIDEEEKEVHILLPVGGSMVPNVDLTINYEEGWQNPISYSRVDHKEITIESCRKFSVQDINAFVCGRIERTIPDTPVPNEGPVGTDQGPTRALVSQFLYGSSGPDGQVNSIKPGVYDDNGAGIDCQYEPVSAGKLMALSQIQGANFNIRGEGLVQVSFLGGRKLATDFKKDGVPSRQFEVVLRPLELSPDLNEGISRMCQPKVNERWRPRITNGAQPGVWFDLKYMCAFTKPIFSGRSVLSGK